MEGRRGKSVWRVSAALSLSVLLLSGQAESAERYRDMTNSEAVVFDRGGATIITVMCWLYALAYLLIAAVKAIRAVLARPLSVGAPLSWNGASFFLLSACILLAMPYVEYYSKGVVTDFGVIDKVLPSAIFNEWTMPPLLLAMPLFPWVMLIVHTPLRHMRRQGICGLFVALLPYCIAAL